MEYHATYRLANAERITASRIAYDLAHPGKVAADRRAYREAHLSEIATRNGAYQRAHLDEVNANSRAYRKNNREKVCAKASAKSKANPQIGVKRSQIRRARKSGNGVFLVTNKELLLMRLLPCVFCAATGNIHIDHVIPISKGGRHSIGNLQPLCGSCNQSKGANFYIVFKMRKGK